MAPLSKILLHAPLLLGLSFAQEPQNRLSLTVATSTPVPPATWELCNVLGPDAITWWKMWCFVVGRNSTEGDLVKSHLKRFPKPRTTSTTSPIFWPTICPPKTFAIDKMFPEITQLSGSKTSETQNRGICKNTCMQQYLTPVVSTVSGYSGSNCKQVTKTVTYSESPHWGDAHGRLIPKALVYSLAGLNTTATNKPPHCKKTKSKKRQSKTKWNPSEPTSSTSKKGKKHTPPPVPECSSFESCYLRCEKTTDRERKVTFALLLLLGAFAGGVIAFVIGRKFRRNRRVRRREPSGESGPAPTFDDPLVREEVVEVVTVEPRPEEQTVEEKAGKTPAVIVEEPTPTTPRSVAADGASDSVDERDAVARLRVPRASGSDLHDSEGGARLRV